MNTPVRRVMFGSILATLCLAAAAEPPLDYKPLARTFEFQGAERTYFLALPRDFNPDSVYWPLVVVHGGGGNAQTNPKAVAMRRIADKLELPAILILPAFVTEDRQVSRFPVLGEERFLKEVLRRVRDEFRLHKKILLTGYSMGGQFSHRFALANPELVQACAPFAAGTWTTPDGRLLIEAYGEVKNPKKFLSSKENARFVPERLHDLFDARTAAIAGLSAAKDAETIPFLVMCGTLDPRHGIAVDFVSSLLESGFSVEAAWPETPHSSNAEQYRSEFEKYPEHAVLFFKKHTERGSTGSPATTRLQRPRFHQPTPDRLRR